MRPDEHKRRKNENYKKKHNIASGKAKENDPKQKTKKADTKDSKKTDQEKKPLKAVKAGDQPADQDEEVIPPRRLTDNWDRYEEEEEEEKFEPEVRGEDFNTLIAESGGSASRFRFKDEEDWTHEVAGSTSSGQGLTMDFDNLAQALACIPLHERLSLSKDLFTDDQMEEMIRTADMCQKKYKEFHKDLAGEGKSVLGTNKDKDPNMTEKATNSFNSNAKSSPSSSVKMNINAKVNSKDDNTDAKPIDKNLGADLNSLEDDLDSLLSAETPCLKSTELHKPASPKPSSTENSAIMNNGIGKKESSTEDWLDELLGD